MILRTELRRSSAPVVCVGLVVVTLGLLYGLTGPWGKGNAAWDEEWIGLAKWLRHIMMLLWPLVLGAGAWQGLRDRRSRVTELLSSTPRPAWQRAVSLLGALALALFAAYLVLLVVGGVQVATNTSYFTIKWLPVAGVMVLALVGIAALGVGLGRTVPSLLTPPVAAIVGLAVQIVAQQSGWPRLLTPVFNGLDINVFTVVAPEVSLTQAVWFVGIGATGFGLVVAARARTRLVALLPVAVAAGVAAPVLSGVDSAVVADPDARVLVCDDNVCVTRAHEDYLSTLAGPARTALARLAKLPRPPTSVVEMVPNKDFRSPRADVVPVFIGSSPISRTAAVPTDPAAIERDVVKNAVAPLCATTHGGWDAYVGQAVARAVAVAWVTGSVGPVPGQRHIWETERDRIVRAWQAFRELPTAEQHDRVVALRAAARDCRGDLLSIVEGR